MPKIFSAFDVVDDVKLFCPPEEGMTVQAGSEESDINFIYSRYVRTGILPSYPNLQAIYGDAPSITYQEALDLVRETDAVFLSVPAEIRAKFDNNPSGFVEFCLNPDNTESLREMGLSNPLPELVAVPVKDGAQ